MSDTSTKGKMSPFQRWEMASFGDDRPSQVEERTLAANLAAKVNLEEIAKIKETARLDAYTAAYKEAYAQGYAQGLEEGKTEAQTAGKAVMDTEVASFCQVAHTFSERLAVADKLVAHDVLALALDLAEAMVKTSLELEPELILNIVSEAVNQLPSVQLPAQLILNPDDADIVRAALGDELNKDGWRIVADSHMEAGGCRLETAQNMVDASISSRWNRLTEAMKKNLVAPE